MDDEVMKPTAVEIRLFQAIEEQNVEVVKECIEDDDCDVTFQDDKSGASALMIASGVGNAEIVQMLLSEGAPWNAVDREYKCAGDYAFKNGHQNCIDVLLQHAVISEMLLGRALANEKRTLNSDYLGSEVNYVDDSKLMDSAGLAVMMDWEKDLMEQHAAFICHADQQMLDSDNDNESSRQKVQRRAVRVLNVGFGMGIVDTAIASHQPTEHFIIEAHPTVYAHLQESGWTKRPGVTVLFGRWQDVLPQLEAASFDGIFFDTYAEDDRDLHQFHAGLPRLLKPGSGRYSFYNGLCPDNVFFHAVSCETVRLELAAIGLSCDYEAVKVDVADPAIWAGVKTRYWYFDTYYLPRCRFQPVTGL